jgi:hypothetical protein
MRQLSAWQRFSLVTKRIKVEERMTPDTLLGNYGEEMRQGVGESHH